MKKYHGVNKNFQFFINTFKVFPAYRASVIGWSLAFVMTTVMISFLWISSDSEIIAGFSKKELVTYNLIFIILEHLIGFNIWWEVYNDIFQGKLKNYLLKPLNYFQVKFCAEAGFQFFSLLVSILAFYFCLHLFKDYFEIAWHQEMLYLIIMLPLSLLLYYTIQFCIGLASFWITHCFELQGLILSAMLVLGGLSFPIYLLPANVLAVAKILPFRYAYSVILEVIFHRISNQEIKLAIIGQVIWIVFFYILYQLMWKYGNKKYAAYGD